MTYFHLQFYFLLSLSWNKTTYQISTFDIFVFIEIMVLLSCHSTSQGQVKFPSFYLSRILLGRMQFKQYFYRWKSPLIIFLLFWWHARLESCLYVFLNHGKYIITNRVGDVMVIDVGLSSGDLCSNPSHTNLTNTITYLRKWVYL